MFTGIIRKNSNIISVQKNKGALSVWIQKPEGWKIKKGDSISINGICSTVSHLGAGSFGVEYMEETLKKTTANDWKKGDEANLEKSLKMSDALDGHMVTGHVDAAGKVSGVKTLPSSTILQIQIPGALLAFVAEKGSVAVNGVSLTVVSQKKDWLTVSLVSYTLEHTNLKKLRKGDRVNIETDILSKYLAKHAFHAKS